MIDIFRRHPFLLILLASVLLIYSCSKNSDQIHNNFNSTLWMQSSAEYKANAIQTYRSANHYIYPAINDNSWVAPIESPVDPSSLPVAVIFDVDETVLDNSAFSAQQILDGTNKFDPDEWDKWVAMRKAKAVPGAVDFINSLNDINIAVFYITNRACKPRESSGNDSCPQRQDTFANLKKVGINKVSLDNILLKNQQTDWGSEKKSRREYVASNYRVIMLFGDNLGDFLPYVSKNTSTEQRDKFVEKYQDNWGKKWYMLSNPSYGSWLNILDNPKAHLQGYK